MSARIPLALLMVAATLSACSSYYMVRDLQSGATYYTRDVNSSGDAGAVAFKYEATGSKVTIQQSEVREISEDEYEAGIKRR